jgi:hypothetical protein
MNCCDRLAAGQAAVILLVQLAIWLGTFFAGFALLVWPLTANITTAFSTAGPALWTFGSSEAHGFYEKTLLPSTCPCGRGQPLRFRPGSACTAA